MVRWSRKKGEQDLKKKRRIAKTHLAYFQKRRLTIPSPLVVVDCLHACHSLILFGQILIRGAQKPETLCLPVHLVHTRILTSVLAQCLRRLWCVYECLVPFADWWSVLIHHLPLGGKEKRVERCSPITGTKTVASDIAKVWQCFLLFCRPCALCWSTTSRIHSSRFNRKAGPCPESTCPPTREHDLL